MSIWKIIVPITYSLFIGGGHMEVLQKDVSDIL